MSFPLISSPGVFIAPGAVTQWDWNFGGTSWPGNVHIEAQPLGPIPTVLTQQSPGLVTTPGNVFMNLNGSYTFWVTVTNSSTNQSGMFGLQASIT